MDSLTYFGPHNHVRNTLTTQSVSAMLEGRFLEHLIYVGCKCIYCFIHGSKS